MCESFSSLRPQKGQFLSSTWPYLQRYYLKQPCPVKNCARQKSVSPYLLSTHVSILSISLWVHLPFVGASHRIFHSLRLVCLSFFLSSTYQSPVHTFGSFVFHGHYKRGLMPATIPAASCDPVRNAQLTVMVLSRATTFAFLAYILCCSAGPHMSWGQVHQYKLAHFGQQHSPVLDQSFNVVQNPCQPGRYACRFLKDCRCASWT